MDEELIKNANQLNSVQKKVLIATLKNPGKNTWRRNKLDKL
jgi:hypothetical protein